MSDLIDRQTAQRLFRKAISFKEHVGKMMWSTSEVKEWVAEFIEDLPSVSTELSNNSPKLDNKNGELISRQDAIDAINAYLGLSAVSRTIQNMTSIQGILENLPSAEPDKDLIHLQKEQAYMQGYEDGRKSRKKGKWIPQNMNKSNGMISTAVYYYPKCSVCGWNSNYTNFCPNCGAEMREGEEDE